MTPDFITGAIFGVGIGITYMVVVTILIHKGYL